MDLVLPVFEICAPVILLTLLGLFWAKTGNSYDIDLVTKLVMNMAIPCLIFIALMQTKINSETLTNIADSTRQCNFTHGMKREAAMPKCFSPSKVKEHECEPTTASLRVSVTKFMH